MRDHVVFPFREILREAFSILTVDPICKIPVSLPSNKVSGHRYHQSLQGPHEKTTNTAGYEQLTWKTL